MVCEIREAEVILRQVTLADVLAFFKVWAGGNKNEVVFSNPAAFTSEANNGNVTNEKQ